MLSQHLFFFKLLLLPLLCHGEYSCTGRQSYIDCLQGMESRVADVIMSPTACTDSEVKFVFKGNTETLECRVSRDLEIIFHGWDFYPSNPNRSLIENIDANSRFSTATDRLTISDIQPEDEGVYVCRATQGDMPDMNVIAGCLVVQGNVTSYNNTVVKLPASMDSDVILPTEVVFENLGYCNVTPVYTQARLRNERTQEVVFQCSTRSCVLDNEIVYYNFSSLGNVTLRQPVEEVAYLMALIQDCPSGTVLRMTYDVTFTTTGSTSLPTESTTASSNEPTLIPSSTLTPGVANGGNSADKSGLLIVVSVVFTLVTGGTLATWQ